MADQPMPDPSQMQSVPDPQAMQGAPMHQGMQEGGSAPMMQPQQPVPDPVTEDGDEFTARDRLELQLLLSAERMSKAADMMTATDDAAKAADYATAAQRLTQAAVLLAPQEAADDALSARGGVADAQYVQAQDTATKGLRRRVQ